MELSIVIVNWNVKPLLERCLESIFKNIREVDFETIIFDNGSTDGSREFLEKFKGKDERLKIVLSEKNLGFATACNLAAKETKGEFILFLNPDTEILRDNLKVLLREFKKNKDWGVIGGQVVGVDGKIQPSVRSFPTLFSQILILLKLHHFFPGLRPLQRYFCVDFDYAETKEVDQVMGACFLVRKKIFEKLHGFDEKFFLWFEEVDFCRRVKNNDFKVIYTPHFKILHYGAQSFSQLFSFQKQKIFNQSLIYYFKKHDPKKVIFLKIFFPLSLLMAFLAEFIRKLWK